MKNKWWIIGGVIVFLFVLKLAASPRAATTAPERKVTGSLKEAQVIFDQAAALEGQGETLQARESYQKLLEDYPDFDKVQEAQNHLEELNIKIIFSDMQTPNTIVHVVEKGDSLSLLGKKYNTTVALLKRGNNLKSDIIRLNQRLRIWQGKFSVSVDKSQNKMILRSDGKIIKVYNVATGRDNSTPVGKFKIETKIIDPVWFKAGAIIPPDSPKNELGSRWMGFDLPGYGIHGTIDPQSIGQQATAGCVRMHKKDVEELYDLLPIGTEITITD